MKLDQKKIKKIISFATEAGKLKELERFRGQFYWRNYPQRDRYESVADHTWRIALFLILIKDFLKRKIDLTKALQMIVVHDLPEIVTGDESPLGDDGTGKKTYAFDPLKAKKRHANEKKAAKHLFGQLPKEQKQRLFELWLEYEEQKSFESKLIKSLDKLEAVLQVQEYRKGSFFKEHLDFNLTYGLRGSEIDPVVTELARFLKSSMLRSFKEYKNK
ncbi:MAG: HD domain-containing protein [Patescibacteria group bacterium]